MIKLDNDIMLNYFQNNNETKYYENILEIINIGDSDSDIINVEYFSISKDDIITDHIKLATYKSNVLIIYINTNNICLIDEICTKIWNEYESYTEIQISVSDVSVIKSHCIAEKFIIKDTANIDDGVYALLDKEKLKYAKLPDNIEIIYFFDNDSLNNFMKINKSLQDLPDEYKKLYDRSLLVVIFENNKLAGYIYSKNTYKNYFYIDWIYVYPIYRGKKYGVLLTSSFSYYCIDNGFMPYYGTAISKYSTNVALQCGYEKIYWSKSYLIEKIYNV